MLLERGKDRSVLEIKAILSWVKVEALVLLSFLSRPASASASTCNSQLTLIAHKECILVVVNLQHTLSIAPSHVSFLLGMP
jgi:hypothetical protein